MNQTKTTFFLAAVMLALLCSCTKYRYVTSGKLDRKSRRGIVEKTGFASLPPDVQKAYSQTWDEYQRINAGHCNSQIRPKSFLELDTSCKIENVHYVYYELLELKALFTGIPGGKHFEYCGEKFVLPDYMIRPICTYQNKLFLMGLPPDNPNRVYKCDDPDYWKVNYQAYDYWIVDMNRKGLFFW